MSDTDPLSSPPASPSAKAVVSGAAGKLPASQFPAGWSPETSMAFDQELEKVLENLPSLPGSPVPSLAPSSPGPENGEPLENGLQHVPEQGSPSSIEPQGHHLQEEKSVDNTATSAGGVASDDGAGSGLGPASTYSYSDPDEDEGEDEDENEDDSAVGEAPTLATLHDPTTEGHHLTDDSFWAAIINDAFEEDEEEDED